MRLLAALCAVVATLACAPKEPSYLVIATTTSVGNSGLLDPLLASWRRSGGTELRPVLAGSGRALRMLELGQADVVISHAPEAERDYLARHPRWLYRKIMFNRFVVVGPAADPARVRSAKTLEAALRRMAGGGARFVSRGDGSGTHERELALWTIAGTAVKADRLVTSGAGMSATLRQASELGAYTLTDLATFEQMKSSLALTIVSGGDPRLLNTYAVIVDGDGARTEDARRFATWLADGDGRTAIERYRIPNSSTQPFTVWPDGAPDDTPSAVPPS